jgi:hypothetical protein
MYSAFVGGVAVKVFDAVLKRDGSKEGEIVKWSWFDGDEFASRAFLEPFAARTTVSHDHFQPRSTSVNLRYTGQHGRISVSLRE